VYRYSRLLTLEPASDQMIESVTNWIEGMRPISKTESHFMDDHEDMLSLTGGQNNKELLERVLDKRLFHLFNVKVSISVYPLFTFCIASTEVQLTSHRC